MSGRERERVSERERERVRERENETERERTREMRFGIQDPLSTEEGTSSKVRRTYARNPRPKLGLECLICAKFA